MEDHKPTPIKVCDFNSYAVRAALAREAAHGRTEAGTPEWEQTNFQGGGGCDSDGFYV